MVALDKGGVYSGSKMALKENRSKPFIQFFKYESFTFIIGVAIEFKNMNYAAITIVENCIFYNNIGSIGGSINMEEGGQLIGLSNHFFLAEYNLEMPDDIQSLIDIKQAREI